MFNATELYKLPAKQIAFFALDVARAFWDEREFQNVSTNFGNELWQMALSYMDGGKSRSDLINATNEFYHVYYDEGTRVLVDAVFCVADYEGYLNGAVVSCHRSLSGAFSFGMEDSVIKRYFNDALNNGVEFSPLWRTPDTLGLAKEIVTNRDFTLMPVLADAITDLGCDDVTAVRDGKGLSNWALFHLRNINPR